MPHTIFVRKLQRYNFLGIDIALEMVTLGARVRGGSHEGYMNGLIPRKELQDRFASAAGKDG